MNAMKRLIDKLEQNTILSQDEFIALLQNFDADIAEHAAERARLTARKYFSNKIYIRGLIEFSNYCKNDCYYCGIRCGNNKAVRYRLTKEEILSCCQEGYQLGFRTFVLQGGEDPAYTDEMMADIIHTIKEYYPQCALTLSIGEKERWVYQRFFDVGADRFLLRHETADEQHYKTMHPQIMSLEHRKNCLRELKEIGFQTGCGFMVGSPGQTAETLAEDLLFIKELHPQMVGIGPFIPHQDTPFAKAAAGRLDLTLFLLSLIRLMEGKVLLPATTALGTIAPDGREKGILAGANVVMPNLSPVSVRKKYMLYNNKICTGEESAQCIQCLKRRVESIGYRIVEDRGDY